MERLSIYFTRSHASVSVQDESATRETSAKSMQVVLSNMAPDDQALLVRFCKAIVECAEQGNCARLRDW